MAVITMPAMLLFIDHALLLAFLYRLYLNGIRFQVIWSLGGQSPPHPGYTPFRPGVYPP